MYSTPCLSPSTSLTAAETYESKGVFIKTQLTNVPWSTVTSTSVKMGATSMASRCPHYRVEENRNAFFLAFILITTLAALICSLCFSLGTEPQETTPLAAFYSQKVWGQSLIVAGGRPCGLIMSTPCAPRPPSLLWFPCTGFLISVPVLCEWFKIPLKKIFFKYF